MIRTGSGAASSVSTSIAPFGWMSSSNSSTAARTNGRHFSIAFGVK